MKFYTTTLILFLFMAFSLNGQNQPHCGTDEFTELLINNNPEIAEEYRKADSAIAHTAQLQQEPIEQAPVHTIPVVVHIIYNSDYDNISRSQVEDGIRVLNEDFRRNNADASNTRAIFQAVAADVEIEFALAKKDPDGNCTDGITRTKSSATVDAHDNVKNLVSWDNDKYLNIWVVKSIRPGNSSGTILGYAYRPFFGQGYDKDGILIRHDRMGTIGTSPGKGRTLTHEVGHFLGLLHPFDDGCQQGDNINDTPPVSSPSYGCNFSRNSCSNDSPDLPDMVENYMDYADDDCQNMFTLGQKNLMRSTLQTFTHRSNLITSSNKNATGVNNPPTCTPVAVASSSETTVCPDDSIEFYDNTEEGDPTSWTWYFEGGQPSVSNDQDPIVHYPNSGVYDVSLVVSNSAGTDSLYLKDYANVRQYWSNQHAEWIEDFENALKFPDVSVNSQEDTVRFEVSTIAASSGSNSLFLDNFNAQATGAVDEFISPNIFTAFGEDLNLTFDYAFAANSNDNSDVLRVQVSEDCGKTWRTRKTLTVGQLKTTTNLVTNPFVPTSSDWNSTSVFLSYYETHGPILIKFQYISGGGNNLYIDNINFSASNVSVDEVDLSARVNIFPNPTETDISVSLEKMQGTEAEINLLDMYGKHIGAYKLEKGEHKIQISGDNLASGIYFIKVKDGDFTHTEKVIFK